MSKLSWETSTKRYVSGENGKLGKWRCFFVIYDAFTSSKNTMKFNLRCCLPGIKDDLGHFTDSLQAKERAQKIVDYWIKESGLK